MKTRWWRRLTGAGCIVLGMVVLAPGCKDNGVTPGTPELHVVSSKQGLTLINDTGQRAHRIFFGRSLLPIIDWGPTCTDANAINNGEVQMIGYQDILGYAASEDVLVYWWHPVADGHGGVVHDSIRTLVVRTL